MLKTDNLGAPILTSLVRGGMHLGTRGEVEEGSVTFFVQRNTETLQQQRQDIQMTSLALDRENWPVIYVQLAFIA